MIKQSLAFNDILEKKFKILRTSIMLGNLRNREETLAEYEETAREIDRIKTKVYEEILGAKIYTTVTLEEEKNKLKDLISFIEERIKERNHFVDDYIKITSNFLDGLDKISLENELNSYKERYNNIDEYLNNCDEIEKLNLKLKDLKDSLEEKYENKTNNELINSKLEDELIDEFNRFISRNSYYLELNYTDIDLELTKIEDSLMEKKSVLDTFASSYQALINAGISGAEREEYSSYVADAKFSYYEDVEKKYVLNIYKLVLDKQVDYEILFNKRFNIDAILNDRDSVRKNLNITKRDELEYFINLCREQFSIIRSQKFNIENIDKLILEISDCENRLDELEKANERKEIVDLLNEFSVETLEIEKVELSDEKEIFEDIEMEIPKKEPNLVISIQDPIKINVKKATDTAKLVMKKVVIILDPKKFSNKKDKLKEVELNLENENQVGLDEKIEEVQEVEINNEDEIFKDNNIIDEKNVENIFEDNIPNDDVVNTIEEVNDIFVEENTDEINIELDTDDIFIDSSKKDNNELIDIKMVDEESIFEDDEDIIKKHVDDDLKVNDNISNNTLNNSDIFFETSPISREKDMFKVTDPFLDDNEFELGYNNADGGRAIIPNIGSIGTVRPNNALSKIEDVVNETNDILLPNLGLVDSTKTDIPIVGENYIN